MAQRDEKGRFVSAKPVLHRQMPEPCAETAEWLQLTAPREVPTKGDRWPWVLFAVGLALTVLAMIGLLP